MKKIIIKSVPYIIVFLLINVVFYQTSDFYKQERKYVKRIETVINNQSEVIFLGDSHVETIKLLDLSDNIGNLAFGGDGINEMYIKVLNMLEYNKNLKYIFIATEPQIFNNTLSSNSTFLNKYISQVDDELEVYKKSKLDLISERIPLFNDSFLRFALNRVYTYFKPDNVDKNKDKDWSKLTDSERKEIAINTGKLDHNSIMTNNDYLETYKKIISLCKTHNIKVFGVRFPVSQHYINQCKEEESLKVDSFIQSLNLHKHFDYSTRITVPEYFHDEDHLNLKGVEKLSEIIFENTNVKLTN
ncbi:hypothetical protein [Flavivirga spongiicola]|uniref:SGNH/GDSL hydrolase family protein n=1 Tax=Flavivirga spongiicola TaxID=421621 RepID=A0ABU7XXG0_9FLAO|nr:hypothetical protein [Flavivirga sp. MEBiC05379]MDO5980483.1 hypothetical protein [Flavivirga sp. MEBiC05379]